MNNLSPHLKSLENESIYIIREAIANSRNPVLLYSIGKDSSVLLHLVKKAFSPASIPFPLLHVDTTWKFSEMIKFRDSIPEKYGVDLITFINKKGVDEGIGPFSHGSKVHTDIMKTEALKKALSKYKFDIIIGGARRDEEKSRAKERIFSFRDENHRWNPKNQRPEVWDLFNTNLSKNESIRVFPISNWTELDIWMYIHYEKINIVPLYFAKKRNIVRFDGIDILVDDKRIPESLGSSEEKMVRFRTLGCYPLSGAIESKASTVPEIIKEMLLTRTSERSGRVIDKDQVGAMERKKIEGYF